MKTNDALAEIKKIFMKSHKVHSIMENTPVDNHYIFFMDGDNIIGNIASYFQTNLYLCENYYQQMKDIMPDELSYEEKDQLIISALNQCGVYNLTSIRDIMLGNKDTLDKYNHKLLEDMEISDINIIFAKN